MINGRNKLSWIDVNERKHNIGTLDELYQKYSLYVENINGINIIHFGDKADVKLPDMFGWTDVQVISKFKFTDFYEDNIDWIGIQVGQKNIILTDDELLVHYNEKPEISIGFHGEVKYKYLLANPGRLSGMCLRVKYPGSEFCKYNILQDTHIDDQYGYKIYTKSGFYNLNDVYMYGKSSILVDDYRNMIK